MGSQGPLKRRCRSKLLVSDSPRGSNSCHCQTARTLTPWRVMMDGRDRVEEFPSDWRSSLLRPTSAHKWHRLVSAVSRARSRFLDGSILAGSIRRGCCGWNVWRQWRRDGRGGFDMSSARAAMLERGSGRMRLTSWTLQRALHDLSGEGGAEPVTCNVAGHSGSKLHLSIEISPCPYVHQYTARQPQCQDSGCRVRVRKILYIRNSMFPHG
jgi:hypothetical protein